MQPSLLCSRNSHSPAAGVVLPPSRRLFVLELQMAFGTHPSVVGCLLP